MAELLLRLETSGRRWVAEVTVRVIGLVLLGLCALAVLWLYHSAHASPRHPPTAIEMVDAAGGFVCWSLGGALLTTGPALFRPVSVPARSARISARQGQDQ